MHESFVPLDVFFRPLTNAEASQPDDAPPPPAAEPATELEEEEETADALAAARRFRAALADALDAAVETLVRDIACEVLARELQLAPVDLAAIVRNARARFADEEPLSVHAHPDECEALARVALPVVADPQLRRGDARLELRWGSIDASLGARLESVLER